MINKLKTMFGACCRCTDRKRERDVRRANWRTVYFTRIVTAPDDKPAAIRFMVSLSRDGQVVGPQQIEKTFWFYEFKPPPDWIMRQISRDELAEDARHAVRATERSWPSER